MRTAEKDSASSANISSRRHSSIRENAKENAANKVLDAFLADLRLRRLTAGTITVSEARIKRFLKWCDARCLDPLQTERDDFLAYLEHLEELGHRDSTLKKDFSGLCSFYEFLEEKGKSNSVTHIRSIRKKYLRSYKTNTQERQIISIEQAARMVGATIDTRDRAILFLLLKTGIRRGELISLDFSDVNMDSMSIRLKPTPKRSNRTVFFDSETQEALRRWLHIREQMSSKDPALFLSESCKRLEERGILNVVVRAAEHVGLHTPGAPLELRFGPHCCRHWFTTHLRRAGMPREFIQELRGDARREAIDIYDHIDKEELRKSYLAHIPQLGV